ncbi:MAG: hypothetical protein AAFZ74_15040 [Pseudomonadota bacterium]
MQTSQATPHYGGQIGFAALLCMLTVTGCVTFSDQGSGVGFLPGWAQQTRQVTPVLPAEAIRVSEPAATFIVRFKNEPELEQMARNFRRDESGTRTAFLDWAAAHKQLDGLQLVRASYSGELILALPMDDPAGRSPRDVIASLETIDNLAYAEIDEMASTSTRK